MNGFPGARIHRELRLASIWTGTTEVMAAIVALERYREAAAARLARRTRDSEPGAAQADAVEEKVYE